MIETRMYVRHRNHPLLFILQVKSDIKNRSDKGERIESHDLGRPTVCMYIHTTAYSGHQQPNHEWEDLLPAKKKKKQERTLESAIYENRVVFVFSSFDLSFQPSKIKKPSQDLS